VVAMLLSIQIARGIFLDGGICSGLNIRLSAVPTIRTVSFCSDPELSILILCVCCGISVSIGPSSSSIAVKATTEGLL